MPSSKQTVFVKIAGLCGVTGPIISLLFVAVAIAYTSEFNWFTWALSDLGVHQAALIFNFGLIVGGILETMFAIGLMQILRKQFLGSVGAFTLVLSTISLCAVGVFPESAGRIHLYVSISFFCVTSNFTPYYRGCFDAGVISTILGFVFNIDCCYCSNSCLGGST